MASIKHANTLYETHVKLLESKITETTSIFGHLKSYRLRVEKKR